MKDKVKEEIILLQYIAFCITIFVLVITNLNNRSLWTMLLFCIFLIFSFYFRNVFLYGSKYKNIASCIFLLDFILAMAVLHLDNGTGSSVLLFLLISDMTLNYSIFRGLILMIICYAGYLFNMKFLLPGAGVLVYFQEGIKVTVEFAVIGSFIFILKFIIKQNETIQGTLKQLSAKTLEQDLTYQELMEAYRKLEDITILRERNKLARELHDTLGHTLTTVLLEIEASKVLLGQDHHRSLEKLELAQEQIRNGMADLRSSVSLLLKGDELVDFKASLEAFIGDTEKHAGVMIQHEIIIESNIDQSIRKTLFRALQEGITNGIKHGNSSVFVFKLTETLKSIEFVLQDNGRGCPAVVQGFGLKSMQERVKEVLGTMRIESETEEGFSLYISIPV